MIFCTIIPQLQTILYRIKRSTRDQRIKTDFLTRNLGLTRTNTDLSRFPAILENRTDSDYDGPGRTTKLRKSTKKSLGPKKDQEKFENLGPIRKRNGGPGIPSWTKTKNVSIILNVFTI